MPNVASPSILSTDLESRIAAFERAFARNSRVDPADYLPPEDHPQYRQMLAEILRVDLELRWARRIPQTIESYLARFPILQTDPHLLGQLAFEEYRQRRQAGENVSPEEYCRHFGLAWEHWPAADAVENPFDEATCAVDCRPMVDRGSWRDGFRAEPMRERTDFPEVGDLVLRRFRIKEPLGRGAFGSVFLAERLDLFHRPVALKFLHGPSVEPAMLAQLIHENIVPIESAERYGSMVVICMPFRGRTTLQHIIDCLPRESMASLSTAKLLASTVRERSAGRCSSSAGGVAANSDSGHCVAAEHSSQVRKLSELEKLAHMGHVEASLRIIAAVANGLAHAHDHNIVHRDLKPANILLADDGTPMILDFNLAATIRRVNSDDPVRLGGTFPYMAPEQIESARSKNECLDPRSDLYSLGVVLFELLTGRLPFPKVKRLSDDFIERMLHDRRTIRIDVRRHNPAVSESVADIVAKLLAYDPADRYQSARHVKEDIERELNNLPLKHARETSWRARWRKYRRRHPRWTTALGLSIFVIAPAMTGAGLQYLSYQRLSERQRAEAIVKRDEALRDAFAAQTLVHSASRDSRLLRLGLARAEQLAESYGLNRSNWEDAPDVRRLTEAEQRELLRHLGETFFVVASAAAEADQRNPQRVLADRVERLQQWADLCRKRAKGTPRLESPRLVQAPHDPSRLTDEELYDLGVGMMAERRYREAASALRELTSRDENNFPAWFRLADCYGNMGQDAEAIAAWTVCVALQPDSAICHFNLACACANAQDFRRAERSFSKSYELDPDLVSALANRAACRSRLGRWDDALADWNQVIEQIPGAAYFRLRRAQCLARLGLPFAAFVDHALGMSIEPDDEFGYSMRGYLRLFGADGTQSISGLSQAEVEGALRDLERAIAINPRNRVTLQNRVAALERLGRWEEAAEAAAETLRQYPELSLLRAQFAGFLARLGREDEALSAIQLALEESGGQAQVQYQAGAVYALLTPANARYRDEAIRHLERAFSRGFDWPSFYRNDSSLKALRGEARFEQLVAMSDTLRAVRNALNRP